MCGIAGWYRRRGRPVSTEILARQCDRIEHRGPDDWGCLADGDFGFGMRRLSIIDVAGGRQPIESPDGRFAVVFNGEIYNHPELRRTLAAGGTNFRTNSDTETLLQAFIHWGDAAWLRLEGMYAAAIWDRSTRVLTLARDPLGIKPLYLTQQQGGVAFASEISPLRVLPGHDFPIDERGVHDFFSFGHIQKPRSIYASVRTLEPGHILRVAPDGEPQTQAFWRARYRPGRRMSERDWIEETRDRLLTNVQRHTLSDVPVGSFLSGGVDSAAVTAAMARSSGQRFKAFTIGFPGSAIDETGAARRIAEHLGCEHVVLPLPAMDAAEVLPAVQSAFDEPTAANSSVPLWALSRLAAEHVKVVLCGEGGDELFLGYKRQRNAARIRRWRPLLRAGLPAASLSTARLGPGSRRLNYLRQHIARLREISQLDTGFKQFFAATQMTSPAIRAQLYERGFWERQEAPDALARLEAEYFGDAEHQSLGDLEQFQLGDLTVHMPGSLLYRLDRASMAHSLEARTPFLTHSFVDWALTMPSDLKMRGKVGKYALRRAVEPWLPAGALSTKKLGFQLPLADWFTGDFSDFGRETWRSSGAAGAGYLDAAAVEALFDEHRRGERDHGRILYAITMFSCWWMQQGQARGGLSDAAPVRVLQALGTAAAPVEASGEQAEAAVPVEPEIADASSARSIRVCFFFNAQRHHLLHGISIAVELSRRPGFDVHVASPGGEHVAYARRLAERLGGQDITFSLTSPALLSALRKATGASVPPKVVSLGMLARHLNGFDAIALPERTSLLLKALGVRSPRYIHLDHGAGDRAAGFDPRIRQFDMVLMAGEKHRRRLGREGLIRDGGYAVVGYPKFDAADAIRDPDWKPFRNGRPVALYAPHFSDLGSWEKFGLPVLKAFAEQDRYNLIVAPHVRMLDGALRRAKWTATTSAFAHHEHMLIDPGGDRSIDMTYTSLADIYLGDVSSQVYEFLRTPKPCVFLDAQGVDWETDENYAHWRFGPVLRSTANLIDQIDAARASHPDFVAVQTDGFDQTFAADDRAPASVRAAEAIAGYLQANPAFRPEPRRRRAPTGGQILAHAAGLLVAMAIGWMAHDLFGPLNSRAEAAVFVDEAVTSHQVTLIRARMRSQPEVRDFDAAEIRKATGIAMPRFPAAWRLTDVQVYPAAAGPIVQVAALTERGEAISFVAMRVDTPAGRTPMLTSRQGDRVAYWEEDRQAFGIVGAIPTTRLLLLASQVARAF